MTTQTPTVLIHRKERSFGPDTKRHTADCHIPKRPHVNHWMWENLKLTDEVRKRFAPCKFCGGGTKV